ncbi:MAG: hypothetical protein ACI9MC_002114, partial [Kiritimatiellia bacterium]
ELGRKRGGCWCHARRGLYDTLKHDETFIQPLLDDIGELFYIEAPAPTRPRNGSHSCCHCLLPAKCTT